VRGEIAKLCLRTTSLFEIVANALVMPGLDPGIHQSSQEHVSKKMDHRVKPGDDDLTWYDNFIWT
jgi:hypothetical protein